MKCRAYFIGVFEEKQAQLIYPRLEDFTGELSALSLLSPGSPTSFPSLCATMRNINEKNIAHCCALLFEVYRSRYAQLQKLSESGLIVLNCFKSSPEKRLKVSDIEKEIELPLRTIQYALNTLTKKAFIQKLGQKAGTRYQLIF